MVGISLAILAGSTCRPGTPVIDTSARPPQADGTISGIVRGPGGATRIAGRTVEVVNIETGERQRTTTNDAGGFTFKVKPGKYEVEVRLLDGEKLVKRPGVMQINRSDVDAHADFIIGAGDSARPRTPVRRRDDGLGAPSA